MINRTIPGFSMNYHISPSWFCLNSQGRASHYQWILWVEKNLRKDQPPSRPLCLLVPILHWREPIPPQMDVEPNISAWPQSLKVASEEIQKNVWSAFDTRKIGEYVHIKKVTWQRMKQCFAGAGICGIGAFSSFWKTALLSGLRLISSNLSSALSENVQMNFYSKRESSNELMDGLENIGKQQMYTNVIGI